MSRRAHPTWPPPPPPYKSSATQATVQIKIEPVDQGSHPEHAFGSKYNFGVTTTSASIPPPPAYPLDLKVDPHEGGHRGGDGGGGPT